MTDSSLRCDFCSSPAIPGTDEWPMCRDCAGIIVQVVDVIDGPAKGWRSERAQCRVCGHKQISCFPVTADADALECGKCHNMTVEVEK